MEMYAFIARVAYPNPNGRFRNAQSRPRGSAYASARVDHTCLYRLPFHP